jgi:hypothetical protein
MTFFMCRLANALLTQGKHDEALAIYIQIMPVIKRVLGPDHGLVLHVLVNYAMALASCGRLVEAEAMLVDTLPAVTRGCWVLSIRSRGSRLSKLPRFVKI